MSQAQSVEAARVRIQRLVDEIAALSKSETRSEEFYSQFLSRAVAACDGRGGAVWLVGRSAEGKSEFQLAAQVEMESSLFQADEEQRTLILRCLSEVVQTKKPMVLSAESAPAVPPGSLQAQLSTMSGSASQKQSANRTPYPFVHVPLLLKDQVLGVLQVWLQPYVTRENYNEFATFLTQIASHAENHFQSRRMGNMAVENQRLQHLLKFVTDLTGTLEPLEVAKLATNYGRDLLGCERCAVVRRRGTSWEMLAISGQEVVEKKSTLVKTMVAFVDVHIPTAPLPAVVEGSTGTELKPHIIGIGRKELLALSDGTGTNIPESRALALQPHGPTAHVDADYFELGQVHSTLIVQLLDADKNVVGALMAESNTEGFFEMPLTAKEPPSSHRLAEWIANNTGRALRAAFDHKDLPFQFFTRPLREARRKLTGSERLRHGFWMFFWFVLIFGTLFFPYMDSVSSDCTLMPEKRVKVVPEVPGRVQQVYVREGKMVKKGDKLAQLDTSALDAELKHSREEMVGAIAEVDKYRGMGDPASEQIAQTKVRAAEEKIKRLEADIKSATLVAPFDGIVLTKDIELTEGVYLSAGADYMIIGSLEKWDIVVHVPEKKIGSVERLMKEKKEVPVRFILYSQSTHELSGVLKDKSQISQVAYPHQRENALAENAFMVTLHDVQAPPEVRRGFKPDLTGRANIELGREPLIFIWGKNIADWFRFRWMW